MHSTLETIIHLSSYPLFKELRAKLIGVFGNNDGGHEFLKKRFRENERLEIRGNFAEITFGELKIALLHGSDRELLKSLVKGENSDLIVHGHTHNAETYRKGETLVVNSGEVWLFKRQANRCIV